MKREHFLVAELYRHLATFVNADREIFLSLDGIAAQRGVRENLLKDSDVPDLCFTFIDGREVSIEVKISVGDKISAGRNQYEAWFHPGGGAHMPTGWVVANEKLDRFLYCSHADMVKQRTSAPSKSENRYVGIKLPTKGLQFSSVRELALHIIRHSP